MLDSLYNGIVNAHTKSKNDIVITKEIADTLVSYVFKCEDDLKNNEDFLLKDVPIAMDGIKWFVFDYLRIVAEQNQGANKND